MIQTTRKLMDAVELALQKVPERTTVDFDGADFDNNAVAVWMEFKALTEAVMDAATENDDCIQRLWTEVFGFRRLFAKFFPEFFDASGRAIAGAETEPFWAPREKHRKAVLKHGKHKAAKRVRKYKAMNLEEVHTRDHTTSLRTSKAAYSSFGGPRHQEVRNGLFVRPSKA